MKNFVNLDHTYTHTKEKNLVRLRFLTHIFWVHACPEDPEKDLKLRLMWLFRGEPTGLWCENNQVYTRLALKAKCAKSQDIPAGRRCWVVIKEIPTSACRVNHNLPEQCKNR